MLLEGFEGIKRNNFLVVKIVKNFEETTGLCTRVRHVIS